MDWRALLRNRWTWIAAGGGALLGGVTYLVRRKGGTSAAAPAGDDYAGFGNGTPGGFYDSTGADLSSQLAQRESIWNSLFADFTRANQQALVDFVGDINERISLIQVGSQSPASPLPPATSSTAAWLPPSATVTIPAAAPPAPPAITPPKTSSSVNPAAKEWVEARVPVATPTAKAAPKPAPPKPATSTSAKTASAAAAKAATSLKTAISAKPATGKSYGYQEF